MGPPIAKWIAEIHRADLSVSSEEEKGTTFQVVFPCALHKLPAKVELVGKAGL